MKKPMLLPDVAEEKIVDFKTLDWVGMNDIEIPVQVISDGQSFTLNGRVRAEVSLDSHSARGIHMSRLFLLVQDHLANHSIDLPFLQKLTADFLISQNGLAKNSRIELRLQLPVRRRALKSDHWAWRSYPLVYQVVNRQGVIRSFASVSVLYSSTCPASAALARQLVGQQLKNEFGQKSQIEVEKVSDWLNTAEGVVATPHAQRSRAQIKVEVGGIKDFNPVQLINLIEEALQTPVQGAVKRIDEQEFARRNGKNLMFCEDAARRVALSLDKMEEILWYRGKFEHYESLHSHNAISVVSRRK